LVLEASRPDAGAYQTTPPGRSSQKRTRDELYILEGVDAGSLCRSPWKTALLCSSAFPHSLGLTSVSHVYTVLTGRKCVRDEVSRLCVLIAMEIVIPQRNSSVRFADKGEGDDAEEVAPVTRWVLNSLARSVFCRTDGS
jgi:hypothetical protein